MQSFAGNFIKAFEVNTEAIATNRGFYYQYLLVLTKWIQHFINGLDIEVATEVDDDIKEVGENLIFTQVKCYSSHFSFQSEEIQKTLFNFFLLFLKNKELMLDQEFHFETNTSISKREKLLTSWTQNPGLLEEQLLQSCIQKAKEVLSKELKSRKIKKLAQKGISEEGKAEIILNANQFETTLTEEFLKPFVRSVRWQFHCTHPEEAVQESFKAVSVLLEHEKFNGKPINVLLHVLLSEIYKRSQYSKSSDRVVTNALLQSILDKTDQELNSLIHYKFVHLIGVRIDQLQANFGLLQNEQLKQRSEINLIRQIINTQESSPWPPTRELTPVPYFNAEDFFGREQELDEVEALIIKKKMIAIYGEGGSGKTAFALKYLTHFEHKFSYVIWLSPGSNLLNSIVFNDALIQNLQLEIPDETTVNQKFNRICNQISKLPGNIMWVIDDLPLSDDLKKLDQLLSIRNSSILITTQNKLQEFSNYRLRELDFKEASRIYYQYIDDETDDEILSLYFDFIHFNPLIIELSCKLIRNSIDLNLKELYILLKNQKLDSQELKIDIYLAKESHSVHIYSFLQKLFRICNLNDSEMYFMLIFSLFPSGEMSLPEIIAICGKEAEEQNKISFTNMANILERKGWLERDKNKLRMHRIIQELVLYENRNTMNPFTGAMLIIPWLTRRIKEALIANPKDAFVYLKYAESILQNIKKEYRISLDQPLLLLENELLLAYDTLSNDSNTHFRWLDLVERAKSLLSKEDENLGVMYNNLALSYVRQGEYERSFSYSKMCINILKAFGEKHLAMLIKIYGNLFSAYLMEFKFQEATLLLKESINFFKKYNQLDNPLTAIHYNTLGIMYSKLGQIDIAEGLYESAISVHTNIPPEKRSDKDLATYYSNLAFVNFQLGRKEMAVHYQLLTVSILESMALTYLLIVAYNQLALLYEEINESETANVIREKVNKLS